MKILIAEDDFASRLLLRKLLAPYGEVHVAVNGKEAVQAFHEAELHGAPYGLVCLDSTMPGMDGTEALREIRKIEDARGVTAGAGAKIIMTTPKDGATAAPAEQCDAYLVKPIEQKTLRRQMASFGIAA